MAFEPDIIVTAAGDPRVMLVVEAKTRLPDLERTEADLKRYMVHMQVPVGILVTPERLWLYRDSYTARTPESVHRIGDYDLSEAWRQPPPTQGSAFEVFVQDWLEDLTKSSASGLSQELSEAIQEHIVPAIAGGEVRAAHPRYS